MTPTTVGQSAPYQVKLPIFEGPLGLLLHLIQSRKLDVSLVSLAAITGNYLEHVRSMQAVRASDVAEFLAVAAQLLAVKSRLLLPRRQDEDERGDEPGSDELLSKLEAYQHCKARAARLAERLDRELASFAPLRARNAGPRAPADLEAPSVVRLRDVLQRLVAASSAAEGGAPAPFSRAWIEVETCIHLLRTRLSREDQIAFTELLGDASTTDQVVGMFLALLHMRKWDELEVAQKRSYAEISIVRGPTAGDARLPYQLH